MTDPVSPLPSELEGIAHEVALEVQSQLDALAERWYDRMREFPELAPWGTAEVRELALHNARIDIGRELVGLVNGRRLPRDCPAEVVDSARLGVEVGLPLWAALQSYRAGHATHWAAWSEAVERRALDTDARSALLRAGSDYMFAYADRCARWMEREYTRARDAKLRHEEQRRMQLVRRVLEGDGVDTAQLGYELDRWHVGLVVTGPSAETVGARAAEQLRVPLLVVAAGPETWWLWLGLARAPTRREERVLRRLEPPVGGWLGVGEPAQGQAGFRRTHWQALRAATLGAGLERPVTTYADVALEDLATADETRARAFVNRELGPLAEPSRQAHELRQTLFAYFASAQRASSAATSLGVHERTIANRLRKIEQLIGASVADRRAELEVALRLRRLLGGEAPDV